MSAGRRPARRIPVARPSFDAREEALLLEALRSGWVTQGPRVAEFERIFAERTGTAEAIAVTSGTTALFLAFHAMGIGPGDEVIVPSLSFIATANVVVHCGAVPVFVDVEPRTYNVDPGRIEAAITPRTRAVMPVHQLGLPADLDRIHAVARPRGIAVLEDAACALGSLHRGKPIGSAGNTACFSFHPRKVIVTGEGGMITTDDRDLAARLRRLRHQGMSVSDLERHAAADRVIIEDYPEVGYNFRLSDLQAAVGIAQMEKLDRFLARRREIAERYDAALAGMPALVAPVEPPDTRANYQSYIVRLEGSDRVARDRLLDAMAARGVATRPGLMAIHAQPCYAGARGAGDLPHTEAAAAQTFILPMFTDLTEADQDFVIASLGEALDAVRAEGPIAARRETRP
jgi:dTDP-4-amino-4,6-dideoxygalactose transaminase